MSGVGGEFTAEKAACGCTIGGVHEYGCASVGHVDPPRRAPESDDLLALATAAISVHRDLHKMYGNTAVCGGGIGGAAMTQHCGVTCGYHERHEADNNRWYDVERAYFRRQDGDPEWADYLPGRRLSTNPIPPGRQADA